MAEQQKKYSCQFSTLETKEDKPKGFFCPRCASIQMRHELAMYVFMKYGMGADISSPFKGGIKNWFKKWLKRGKRSGKD